MSTQNKYDLILLGNMTVDDVYCLSEWAEEGTSNKFESYTQSVGALGNIIQALNNSGITIYIESIIGNDSNAEVIKTFIRSFERKLHLSKKPTSKALILSNLKSKERTSFVNWGCGHDLIIPSTINVRWKHISYLDILPPLDLKESRQNSDIMSADLCLSNPSNIESTINQLHYFDYLFASESEIYPLINNSKDIFKLIDLVNSSNLKCLVFHTRTNTYLVYKNSYKKVKNNYPIIENVNVLGAGDVYCASFIKYQLNNTINDKQAVDYAHEQATKYIVLKKDEKV